MIHALFFDLDGTLLSSRKMLLPSSTDALRRCREKGIKIFLATARSPMLAQMLHWTEAEFSLFDGGIYCNGACEQIGTQVEYAFLPPDAVRFCVAETERYENLHIALHMKNEIHAFNHTLPDFALGPWGLNRGEIAGIDESSQNHTVKILIYYDNLIDATRELPPELFRKLQEHCAADANIYLTDGGRTIQVVGKNVSKRNSVEKVRRMLGLTPEKIAVFGDDSNDLEMLACTPNSVAMGNAVESVQQAAAYITRTNDEDGIAYALEKLLAIL